MSVNKNGIWKEGGAPNPNMLTNSRNFSGWSIGSGWTSGIAEDGATYYTFTRTGATANNWIRIIPTLKINPVNYPNGIAVSFDFKVDDLSIFNQKCICALQNYNDAGTRTSWVEPNDINEYINGNKIESGKWIRLTKLWTQAQLAQGTGTTYSQLSFQLVQNGTIYIKNIKCEDGNFSTAWTPNINDYEIEPSSFIEGGNITKIQKNGYIEANSFIEI